MVKTAGEALAVHGSAGYKVGSVRAVGTRAVLAELTDTQSVLALQALLLESPLPGQLDVLAAAETVLVTADSPGSARRIAAQLLQLDLSCAVQRDGGLVVIDTVYDGEDLAEVGELTGLGTDGVIAAHTASCGRWPSPVSPRASATSSGRTKTSTFPDAVHHAPPCPPDPWRWPVPTRPSIRAGRPAAGS